jgi:hypothetical protein
MATVPSKPFWAPIIGVTYSEAPNIVPNESLGAGLWLAPFSFMIEGENSTS